MSVVVFFSGAVSNYYGYYSGIDVLITALPITNIISVIASEILYLLGKQHYALYTAILLPAVNIAGVILFVGPSGFLGPQYLFMWLMGR